MSMINPLIINHNNKQTTFDLLYTLKQQFFYNVQIVLVENGCKQNEILEEGSFTHLILNKNYGFPAAVNVGVKACEDEWVLVLNNDCLLREDFMKVMEKEIDSCRSLPRTSLRGRNDNYQIFSPKIYQGKKENKDSSFPSNSAGRRWNDNEAGENEKQNIIYSCGDKIDANGLAGNIGRGEVDRGQYDKQKEVPLASFACILVKKELLDKFPLDESYFGYYEDVDFGLRVAKAGYKIKFVPQAVCYHLGEASFGKLNNLDNEMRQFRNLSFTVIKNFPLSHIVRHWIIFNFKSFRYYFFMKKQWKFLLVEWQIVKKLLLFILR